MTQLTSTYGPDSKSIAKTRFRETTFQMKISHLAQDVDSCASPAANLMVKPTASCKTAVSSKISKRPTQRPTFSLISRRRFLATLTSFSRGVGASVHSRIYGTKQTFLSPRNSRHSSGVMEHTEPNHSWLRYPSPMEIAGIAWSWSEVSCLTKSSVRAGTSKWK